MIKSSKNKESSPVRVRLAPSPTGSLHLGVARTALFNYLWAKKNQGQFILRIEDTDLERSEKRYEKDILDNLKWLGLVWDEGPFYQSQRGEIYQSYIQRLFKTNQAFYCSHTLAELEKEKKEQMKRGEAPRHLCSDQGKKRKRGVIRFRCPDQKVVFNDLIRGRLEFKTGLFGDIAIARDETTPLYNLAVVVDDYEMKISQVIRGEDHISNTPKQILIGQALGLPQPQFAHLPLILGPDRTKLSKRHGAVSIAWYRSEGYLSEAMINFMALLGWNPGTNQEIFSLKELIKEFSLARVQKGGAVFDLRRLDWLNGYYIRQKSLTQLTKLVKPYFKNQPIQPSQLRKLVALEQERLKRLSQITKLTQFFFKDKLNYSAQLLVWKNMSLDEVSANLEVLFKILSGVEKFKKQFLEKAIRPLTEKYGRGELLWPLRVALTGQAASAGPFEIMEVLGKRRTLERLKEAQEIIKKSR